MTLLGAILPGARTAQALILTASIGLWASPAAGATWRVTFDGRYVYEEHTGLTALPDDTAEHVILSSETHHFWLVLPYSEVWSFESGKKLPLVATNAHYEVSIRVAARGKESDREFLRQTLVALAPGTEPSGDAATILEVHDRAILRYPAPVARAADSATWNYLTVVPRGKRWYLLTLIFKGEPDEETDERILDILGAGFGADFQVD